MTTENERSQALADRIREILLAFERSREEAVDRLTEVYDRDVVFQDPLQTLHGRDAFLAMNRRIVLRSRRLAFDVKEAVGSGSSVFMAWVMDYQPRIGPTIVFEGVTHLRVKGDLVVFHRDYWDLLSSVAESVPLVRRVYASLAPHLA
jgi:steroid Delta-isomerase